MTVLRPPASTGKARQPAVDLLLFQAKVAKLPVPKTEWRFHAERKWRVDIAWPYITNPLICEVDGGLFIPGGGRHSRGVGREKDYERDAAALLMGFRILRVSPGQVKSGKAILWLQDLLHSEGR